MICGFSARLLLCCVLTLLLGFAAAWFVGGFDLCFGV